MMDIVNAPESDLTIEGVRAFLGIDELEISQRPKEGPILDYKGKHPSDLAKLVVALANTDGGIAFLGVDEDHGAPTAMPGFRENERTRKQRSRVRYAAAWCRLKVLWHKLGWANYRGNFACRYQI